MKNHLDLLENYANNETLNTKCRREIYKKVNGYGNSIQSTLDSQTSINRINNELVNNSSNTDFAQPNELKYIKYIENYINKLESEIENGKLTIELISILYKLRICLKSNISSNHFSYIIIIKFMDLLQRI